MSEGEKKKIVIDANMFNMSSFAGGKSRKRGVKREKPNKEIKMKTDTRTSKAYKTQIMKKIREEQNNKYKNLFASEKNHLPGGIKEGENKDVDEFKSSFKESIDFFKNVADTQPVQPPKNHTFKNNSLLYHSDESLSQTVNLDLPKDFFDPHHGSTINVGKTLPNPAVIKPAPILNAGMPLSSIVNSAPTLNVGIKPQINSVLTPLHGGMPLKSQPSINPMPITKMSFANQPKYGCLKGGQLPTYRSQTQKLRPQIQPVGQQPIQNIVKPSSVIGAISLPIMRKLHEQKKEAEKPKPKIVQKKIKKLLRRTFHVGKNKLNRGVGVLLPNRTIRNNVTTKSYQIKTTPINEIRKFLINRGFIKVGSTAPTDVLRKMYESLVLIGGEVKNHNPDNLLYNFFTGTHSTDKKQKD